MSSRKGTPNNITFRQRIQATVTDLLADRRHGKFGVVGEVFDGIIGFYEEIREPKFLPKTEADKKRVNEAAILGKIDEICNVVMVYGWSGSFGLTWEESTDFAVASISIRKKEKALKPNAATV